MEPLISVILPIYNMESYLARSLDSILGNSYQNLEILCVDDGSTDASLDILRGYAEKDSRIVVITKENGGVSSARNAGLDRMTGEFVTFIDPDDFVHPQYFEFLLRTVRVNSAVNIAICGFQIIGDTNPAVSMDPVVFNDSELVFADCEQIFKSRALRSYCCGRLFLSELIKKTRFRGDLHYGEDSLFVAEFSEHAASVFAAINPAPLYYYYQRDNSLTHVCDIVDRFKAAELFTEKAIQSPENERIYLDHAIKNCLSTRYMASHILLDKEIARKCSHFLKGFQKTIVRTKVYNGKEKILYLGCILLPGLYWLYRSITEPYMWKWEKVERRKRREAKNRAAK